MNPNPILINPIIPALIHNFTVSTVTKSRSNRYKLGAMEQDLQATQRKNNEKLPLD